MDPRKAHKASSSSPSSSSKRWEYHIFLSFRGEDTRKGFTSHLHKALESRGYDVFMDEDDLQVGQVIKPELLQAIENSKMSVIVFSTRFADSSWCLDELVKIMECRRTLNQIVLPIFYDVDPSDVRHQTGTLATDFQKHTIRHKDEVVKEWKRALTEAANLCAGVLKDTADRNEAKFIEAFIENNIIGWLSTTPLPVAAYTVGVDSRVHDMISYLLGRSQDVVMIGIWGMGGLGKTTAAKAIYNRIKDKFEAHGFLGDIRDTANRHGLVYLQKLLLAEIYKKPTKFHISCVDGGMGMIKKELGCKRVLVIIDDVDEKEQLKAIVGNRDWFGSGSRIIITTRDKQFLDVLRVDKTFTVPEMNPDEGLELFCRHAFQKGCPNKRYLELSKKVVFYSRGLPLALEVLGSCLVDRTIAEWESQLEELEGIPPKEILKKLRISYDGLDRNEKCIFLDISCFFIGMNKHHVRKILDGCGFKAEIKISVLRKKCLLTVNEKNQLMMHDLLRDMGRAICQEGDPEDRTRLWLSPEDATDVLEDKSETTKVEGLALNLRSLEKASFGTKAFRKMTKLKLLQLNYVELTGEYKFLSKNLRWLCWHGFLLDSIPGDFDLTSLIAMDLQFSKLKVVWKDCKLLEKLTIINLSHSHDLTTSPDFSKVPNLEELILECTSLSDVHESIGDLKRLALVNLEHCRMLKDLPLNLYRSKSIETLLLNGCSRFENLAEGLGDMVSLRTLEADDTAVTKVPSSIVKLKNLRSLSLCGLERLTGFLPYSYLRSSGLRGLEGSQPTGFLPSLLDGLNSLRKLALADCSLTDDELPEDLGSLSSLEHLDCGQNSFCRLPSLIGLSKLEYLCLNDCRKLRAIPELPTNLKVLRVLGCTALETMPDFSKMSSIRELYLSDSYKLTEIPGLDKSLNSVTRIHMEGCTKLTTNFRKKILQGWTSCDVGGIYLEGIYGIPKWFRLVGNEYNEVDFEVPQIFSCDLKGLTLCCVYSSDNPKPKDGLGITVRNITQGTTLHTWPAIASVKTDSKPVEYYLWQGQLSNDRLSLQGGDKVLLSVFATVDFVRVKKAGVNLEWVKVMKENMDDSDPHLYDLDPNPDWLSRAPDEAGPSQGEPLRELVLASCNLTDTAIYNDLGSLISLEYLDLRKNNVLSLPCLSGLVKLEQLYLNHCRNLRAIPDLPTNLKVLEAAGCTGLETMPDVSKMSNMRELYLCDSFKLTEIIGLDKSLNSMTRIHMEGCTNLTAQFRNNIMQGWASCGYGGIFLNGNDIPDWFDFVNENNFVYFTVPQSDGRSFTGLTLSFVYSLDLEPKAPITITITNFSQGTDFDALMTHASLHYLWKPEEHYLWQGQLSNDVLQLQEMDKVRIHIVPHDDFAKVMKTGVNLVWDKLMKENMIDYNICGYKHHPSQNMVNDYAAYSVGITSRVEVLSNHLDFETSGSKNVRMIGILGMPGIGKTTLAKAIYNKFEGSFEVRSFLADVREVFANQRSNGLVGLQEQLLNDILKGEGIKVGSVAKGIDMIRERLFCKRALVIIDDADDLQQLKAIAGARDWFGHGSRIVITTRNQHLPDQVGVDSTYMAQAMDEKEALELFSRHAFERSYPNQEYLDLSKRVIRYCQGLPLALKVLGSFLKKRTTTEWKRHLGKLERSPPDGDIQKILRISFDGLPDHKKREIFLDISCFLIGMDKDYVTQILDGCGFYATIGISVLIERCFVTVSEQNKLMVHDLLRDMGREIVRKNAHSHPEKFSRLWKPEDVTDVLSDESGTKKIEGVVLHLDKKIEGVALHLDLDVDSDLDSDLDLTRFSAQAFTKMKKLRLLYLSRVELTGEYKDFPKNLIWLCWRHFPLESIPDDFPMQPKLVALDLQYSKLKIVWKDCKLHQKLKILNLSYSIQLSESPDFSELPNLEELILQSCCSLSEVHSSIGDLGRLSLVNLEGCNNLEDLPLNFYKSKSIETLILNGCSRFQNLADGLGDMVSLTILEADKTGIGQIPSLAGLSKLKVLCLNACRQLLAIPDLPTYLFVLKANGCPELETIPDFSKMWDMRELYLRDSFKLTEVPSLDKSLNSMTRIHMEGCTKLTADFRNNILQRWTSCGFGGIYLNGVYDIPEWFKIVNDVDNIVFFEVPQKSMGRDLKGLTICFVYLVLGPKLEDSEGPIDIIVRNLTKRTALHTQIAFASLRTYRRPEDQLFFSYGQVDHHHLWQGQLSNGVLRLQGGDQVSILVRPLVDFVRVEKTGVHLEWDKVMKENMDNPDRHLYDLETNRDFSGGVDDAFFRGSVIHEQLAVEPYLDFFGGTDNEGGRSHDASVPGDQMSATVEESAVEDNPFGMADDGAGRSHDAFGRTNQSSVVDEQLAVKGCFGYLKKFFI
ncbi:uncharacterized protein LOC110750727 [Prunus avium]|uniref:Uncharacterized protein LOC110750727 n=3 Tax=Prunus avium TaxID=42229 RepID=A0A6P5RYJ2_PRUAV|nr:uncharacterized protein LOC110750727 [Prunus avium]